MLCTVYFVYFFKFIQQSIQTASGILFAFPFVSESCISVCVLCIVYCMTLVNHQSLQSYTHTNTLLHIHTSIHAYIEIQSLSVHACLLVLVWESGCAPRFV